MGILDRLKNWTDKKNFNFKGDLKTLVPGGLPTGDFTTRAGGEIATWFGGDRSKGENVMKSIQKPQTVEGYKDTLEDIKEYMNPKTPEIPPQRSPFAEELSERRRRGSGRQILSPGTTKDPLGY